MPAAYAASPTEATVSDPLSAVLDRLRCLIERGVVETGGFAGTRRSQFPRQRPPGYFSPDADPAAVKTFFEANGYLVLENAFNPAEIEELKANPDRPAIGTIVEAELDKARGAVATALI